MHHSYAPTLLLVLTKGTYLAHRWKDDSGVNLYHCAGDERASYVEVGFDDGRGQAVALRSFASSEPLEDYAHEIQLPG
ncbi:MAG: hypothetical protein EOO60_05925 [Hymenobacter sp.]|nr:MAG: hypothetical protein EOO60_05925 [Hymenobacter sp.]